MRLLLRSQVMARLQISQSASYRIVGTARGKFISSDDFLAILNAARRGPQPMLTDIPTDLLTADGMAAELSDCGITAHDLHNWTLRTRNVPPHFLINTHCRRFQKSAMLDWLSNLSKIIRRG